MTTEQLRLEIEVAAKEAMKNLSATSDEYKRLAKEIKASIPPANQLKDTMTRLQADLKKSETAAELFDDKLGGLKERQALLRGAMVDLIDKGLAPESQEIQDLKLEYDAAAAASKELETQTGVMSGAFVDLKGSLGAIAAVKVFTTVATGILGAGKAAVSTAGDYEMLKANFETLTGSTAAATAEFNQLKQFANVTPFDLQGVAKSAQILQAAKIPIQDLTTRLGQLGDLSLGNSQKFESMVGAFSKMSIKGKVDLEQLNIVMEAGVPILDELAKGYGKTSEEVFDMLSKGKVSTNDFIAAMERMTSQGGQFFGGMARGAQTFTGVLSTYKDSLDNVAASFGELLLPVVKSVLGTLTNLNATIAASPLFKGLIAGVLVTAVALLGAWAVAMAASTVKTWLAYAAEMALNAAKAVGNPLLLAGIAAVGVATVGYVAYAAATSKAAEATAAQTEQLKLSKQAYLELTPAMQAVTEKTGNVAAAQAAVAEIKKLEAELATLEKVSKNANLEIASSLKYVDLALSGIVNPKSGAWYEGYKTEAEKIKAVVQAIDAMDDKRLIAQIQRSRQYQDALAKGSSAALADAINAAAYSGAIDTKRIDTIKRKLAELRSGATINPTAPSANMADLSESAKKWIAEWDKAYAAARASSSSDPYAALEHERVQKISNAAAEGVTSANAQKTIDEINAYIDTKRKALADKISADERTRLAQLTATKIDDLELQKTAELATWTGTQEGKAAIAADWDKRIAQTAIDEEKAAADARIAEAKRVAEEAARANAAYFDQVNAQRAFDAKYSASKVDDLKLARDRELALFVGTEEQRRIIAADYAKQIAEARIAEARRVFQEELALAKKRGSWGAYASGTFQEKAKDTEVGRMAGFAGTAAVDPTAIFIDALVDFALSLESVQGLLNGFSTMLGGVAEILDPLLKAGTDELIDSLVEIGVILAQTMAPGLSILALALKMVTAILNIFVMPPLKLFGAVMTWLHDKVVVPVGNKIIDAINGIIKLINKLPGVNIKLLKHLQTTDEMVEQEERIAAELEAVADAMEDVQELFDEKKNALREAYDKNISALKNLLELGALSEAEYAARVAVANTEYETSLAGLEAQEDAQLEALEDLQKIIQDGQLSMSDVQTAITNALAGITTVPVPTATTSSAVDLSALQDLKLPNLTHLFSGVFDVGTPMVPEDMVAKVHKGETIIPASFSEGLRRGDLTLSKGGSGTTVVYQTTVHVAGSVQAENDLADSISKRIDRRKARGYLESVT
ncbi:MAG TPA: tape measure protein [Spirochaetales bacterium]|nr:tape measure protein [Spirochaetales bacterium]HRY54297.1 tape measure protein [Spirochaetia bacterium]